MYGDHEIHKDVKKKSRIIVWKRFLNLQTLTLFLINLHVTFFGDTWYVF